MHIVTNVGIISASRIERGNVSSHLTLPPVNTTPTVPTGHCLSPELVYNQPKMNAMAQGRMLREIRMLQSNPPPGVCAWPVDGTSLNHLEAQIQGPAGTVYEKGTFKLDIQIPERYPLEPPKVRFLTPLYHPNVDNGGRICLDTLNMPPKGAWKPSINLSTLLATLGLLLAEPNGDDGLMADITHQFKHNRAEFDAVARAWTRKYAMGEGPQHRGGQDAGTSSNSGAAAGAAAAAAPEAPSRTLSPRDVSDTLGASPSGAAEGSRGALPSPLTGTVPSGPKQDMPAASHPPAAGKVLDDGIATTDAVQAAQFASQSLTAVRGPALMPGRDALGSSAHLQGEHHGGGTPEVPSHASAATEAHPTGARHTLAPSPDLNANASRTSMAVASTAAAVPSIPGTNGGVTAASGCDNSCRPAQPMPVQHAPAGRKTLSLGLGLRKKPPPVASIKPVSPECKGGISGSEDIRHLANRSPSKGATGPSNRGEPVVAVMPDPVVAKQATVETMPNLNATNATNPSDATNATNATNAMRVNVGASVAATFPAPLTTTGQGGGAAVTVTVCRADSDAAVDGGSISDAPRGDGESVVPAQQAACVATSSTLGAALPVDGSHVAPLGHMTMSTTPNLAPATPTGVAGGEHGAVLPAPAAMAGAEVEPDAPGIPAVTPPSARPCEGGPLIKDVAVPGPRAMPAVAPPTKVPASLPRSEPRMQPALSASPPRAAAVPAVAPQSPVLPVGSVLSAEAGAAPASLPLVPLPSATAGRTDCHVRMQQERTRNQAERRELANTSSMGTQPASNAHTAPPCADKTAPSAHPVAKADYACTVTKLEDDATDTHHASPSTVMGTVCEDALAVPAREMEGSVSAAHGSNQIEEAGGRSCDIGRGVDRASLVGDGGDALRPADGQVAAWENGGVMVAGASASTVLDPVGGLPATGAIVPCHATGSPGSSQAPHPNESDAGECDSGGMLPAAQDHMDRHGRVQEVPAGDAATRVALSVEVAACPQGPESIVVARCWGASVTNSPPPTLLHEEAATCPGVRPDASTRCVEFKHAHESVSPRVETAGIDEGASGTNASILWGAGDTLGRKRALDADGLEAQPLMVAGPQGSASNALRKCPRTGDTGTPATEQSSRKPGGSGGGVVDDDDIVEESDDDDEAPRGSQRVEAIRLRLSQNASNKVVNVSVPDAARLKDITNKPSNSDPSTPSTSTPPVVKKVSKLSLKRKIT
eukprot:jgi/Mesvir1/14764/Mv05405-RA.1